MTEKNKKKVLRVTNHAHDGYWRGDKPHPKGTADYVLDHFTRAQRAALEADARIDVREIEIDADEPVRAKSKETS